MEITTKNRLEEIKKNGYRLDFSEMISRCIENYKKIVWINGAAILLLSLILFALSVAMSSIVFGVEYVLSPLSKTQLSQYSVVTIITTVVVGVLFAAIIIPFYAGLLKVSHQAENNQPFDFNTVFYFYKSSFVKDLIVAGVIVSLVSSFCSTLLNYSGYFIWGQVVTYFIQFITLFFITFIIFGKMTAIEAIEASLIMVFRNFFVVLGLMLVAFVVGLLGILAVCIGIFFTLPIIFSMQYVIYDEVIGTNFRLEIEDIGSESTEF